MAWRLAQSLERLRQELDAKYPRRSKRSDGAIGDEAHQARTSDHNPWVPPPRGGVVTAIDITHDPDGGVDCHQLAALIRGRAAAGDRRVKYVIWNRRIASATSGWEWRPYSGTNNPHTQHLHVSVAPILSLADNRSDWGVLPHKAVNDGPKPSRPAADWTRYYTGRTGSRTVKRWDCGKDVEVLQAFIGDTADDGYFGGDTENAVKAYQKMRGLTADGVVGPKTWAPILRALGI